MVCSANDISLCSAGLGKVLGVVLRMCCVVEGPGYCAEAGRCVGQGPGYCAVLIMT